MAGTVGGVCRSAGEVSLVQVDLIRADFGKGTTSQAAGVGMEPGTGNWTSNVQSIAYQPVSGPGLSGAAAVQAMIVPVTHYAALTS